MEIQLFDLKRTCRDTGYNIITEAQQCGPNITEERMDELFQPLLKEFIEQQDTVVNREYDEIMGKMTEREEQERRDMEIATISRELSDTIRVIINGVELYTVNCWYIPKNTVSNKDGEINVNSSPPELEYSGLCYDELINLEDKNSYLQTVVITTSNQILGELVRDNINNDINYNVYQSLNYLELIRLSGAQFSYCYKVNFKLIKYYSEIYNNNNNTCQRVILKGKRKGAICNRNVKSHNLCHYHQEKRHGFF